MNLRGCSSNSILFYFIFISICWHSKWKMQWWLHPSLPPACLLFLPSFPHSISISLKKWYLLKDRYYISWCQLHEARIISACLFLSFLLVGYCACLSSSSYYQLGPSTWSSVYSSPACPSWISNTRSPTIFSHQRSFSHNLIWSTVLRHHWNTISD